MNEADIRNLYRTLARKSFKNFVRLTKSDYQFNWHHLHLIEKLQDFADGKIKRLMVFMPPRHGKSELASRRFPAWLLGRNPRAKIIATSYAAELASSFNRDVQRIIDEPKFKELFPETRLVGPGVKSEKSWLRNNDIFEIVDHGGFYRCAGVGGAITGLGGDFLIVDDPFKNYEEAKSPTIRRRVFEWYTSTLYTRQEQNAGILIIQTRWHEDDLAGMLRQMESKSEDADRWEVVNFPAILETPDSADPREVGRALWPEKYDERWMASTRIALGSFQFSALYQQNPTPDEGQFVKSSWLKTYDVPPDHFDKLCMSWDMTFGSEKKSADFVVGAVYGKRGSSVYLIDKVRGQWDFPETIAQVKRMMLKHPKAQAKLIEAKANGQAVIDSLKKEVPGLIPIVPTSSKASRLAACQAYYEAGNIFYPTHTGASWIGSHIDEIVGFPNVKNDDSVDAETQAIQWLLGRGSAKFSDEFTDFEPSPFADTKINW